MADARHDHGQRPASVPVVRSVPVAAERVILFGVGVLTKPRGRRGSRLQDPLAQGCGVKRVVLLLRHSLPLVHNGKG